MLFERFHALSTPQLYAMKHLSLVSLLAATPLSIGQIPDGFEPAFEDVEIENAKRLRVSGNSVSTHAT